MKKAFLILAAAVILISCDKRPEAPADHRPTGKERPRPDSTTINKSRPARVNH